ncbi:response regulator [Desulfopila inferna]|uniref:response regulator n=1 Tax=Desulfopila inferna TaxID=468528 RepID=UPI001965FE6B|nr:response regulator [Desulfopila inferna]MBM9603652.1 response regulator [Desulfopila inferna]
MTKAKSILIAEDQEDDILLMEIALAELALEGEYAVAQDGQEALDYLYCRGSHANRSRGNPKLMLLDWNLPKINGQEILQEIRKDKQFDTVSVVVFSSSLAEKDQEEALFEGANAFMTKPMDLADFLLSVRKTVATYLSYT